MSPPWTIIISKIIMGAALGYLLFLCWVCPCRRLLCCHLPQFWIAIAVVFAVLLWENKGLKFFDASCVSDL